jgi:predicted MFS family arabinose efflux permease
MTQPAGGAHESTPATTAVSERRIVFLVGAVQFVNIVDFMIVMPLGPFFAAGLGVPTSKVGLVGGAYTLAAAVAGLVGSFFLDRFGRRRALTVAMVGLVVGTALGGLATGLGTLVAARVVAGFFGGPATAIALSIIADVVPPERRGRAMGAVMGAFSAASVLGVPAGLHLARTVSWQAPFFAVAALGAVVVGMAGWMMPPLRGHLARARTHDHQLAAMATMLGRPAVRFALLAVGTTMLGAFSIIPNFSAFFLHNRRLPVERLELLYLLGGLASFVVMRAAGKLVDTRGAPLVAAIGTGLALAVSTVGFIYIVPQIPVLLVFIGFMCAMSMRNVSSTALASRVPGPDERARFMSIQSTVQHMSAALGAFAGTLFLHSRPDGTLEGFSRLSVASLALMALLPPLLLMTERRLRAQ